MAPKECLTVCLLSAQDAIQGRVAPTSSVHSQRYDTTFNVEITTTCIPAGPGKPSPPYIPAGWTLRSSPEGSSYLVHERHRVVADIPHTRPNAFAILEECMSQLARQFQHAAFSMPDDCEICLQTQANGELAYYGVNHSDQALFWFEDVDAPELLQVPGGTSPTHLEYIRQQHYWVHMEYYPHRSISADVVKKLSGNLYQGRLDQLTSSDSTFPYSAQECANLIEVLENGASKMTPQEVTWAAARIQSTMALYRFDAYHGEPHARLSRLSSRLSEPERRPSKLLTLTSMLLFGAPDTLLAELDTVWVDQHVYANVWRSFMNEQLDSWKQSCLWALCSFLSNAQIIQLNSGRACPLPASYALGCAGLSFFSGTILAHRHRTSPNMDATSTANMLFAHDTISSGLRGLATIWSLPRSLFFWSLLGLIAQLIVLAHSFLPQNSIHGCWPLYLLCVILVVLVSSATCHRHLDARIADSNASAVHRFLKNCMGACRLRTRVGLPV